MTPVCDSDHDPQNALGAMKVIEHFRDEALSSARGLLLMGATDTEVRYNPDYAVSPGEVLEETLEARKIKKADLAQRCGLSAMTVSLIVGGEAPITPDTATNFEKALGVSAHVWNNLEANYRLFQARRESRY